MSIDNPTPGIQLFQYFTLKIQRQVHNSRSYVKFNTLSTRVPSPWSRLWIRQKYKVTTCVRLTSPSLNVNSTVLPFRGYRSFKMWPRKSKVNAIASGHIVGPISYCYRRLCTMVNTIWPDIFIQNSPSAIIKFCNTFNVKINYYQWNDFNMKK